MITWIAIGNAILWGGVITFLLFRAMRNQRAIEAQLDQLEAQLEAKREEQEE